MQKVNSKEYVVEIKDNGLRLDKFISNCDENLSRMAIQRLIDEEKITVNGKIQKQSYRVQENDKIIVKID